MYKNSVIKFMPNPFTADEVQTSKKDYLMDIVKYNNLVEYGKNLLQLGTEQEPILTKLKNQEKQLEELIESLKENLENINKSTMEENIKEFCCKGIILSLEESNEEKLKVNENIEEMYSKYPKQQIESLNKMLQNSMIDMENSIITIKALFDSLSELQNTISKLF
jgi:predicted transcriptional regulator